MKPETLAQNIFVDTELKWRTYLLRNENKGDPCPICYEPMNGRYVKAPWCGHGFHIKCLKKWDQQNFWSLLNTCPVCRHEYDSDYCWIDYIFN